MKYAKLPFYLCLLACLLFSYSHVSFAKPARIESARISQQAHKTRLVLGLSQPVKFHAFTLVNPNRVVIDIFKTTLDTNLTNLLNTSPTKKGLVKDIRSGRRNLINERIVLDVTQPVKLTSFLLKPQNYFKNRLVVDLTGLEHAPSKKHVRKHNPVAIHAKPPFKSKQRAIIIVVDPGHGGKDSGAIGPGGVMEKNVVLKIAKDLRADLNRIRGIHAELTRKGDYYLTLRQRLKITRKDHADFFVSIHADAFKDPHAKGASVFALSQHGASSEAAHWLAERENYSELGHAYIGDKSRLLRSVLIDLSQTATISQSLQVGHYLLRSLKRISVLHHDKVDQAAFVVLKSPDIPSLLVETGFITNPFEEHRLNTARYQHKLARALARGIIAYFHKHPPPGTLLALKKRTEK